MTDEYVDDALDEADDPAPQTQEEVTSGTGFSERWETTEGPR